MTVIEGLCCDCIHDGPCCDYSENKVCEHYKPDGSCWQAYNAFRLDRKRWNSCEYCKDKDVRKFLEASSIKYCKFCGRPLTDEAWAELERRIGRCNETTD